MLAASTAQLTGVSEHSMVTARANAAVPGVAWLSTPKNDMSSLGI
jgi:hypothetical protein